MGAEADIEMDLYEDWFAMAARWMREGRTLVVGSGVGSFKDYYSDCISSGIIWSPWLDLVADAMALPLSDGSLHNVICFDVLYHLPQPDRFFQQVSRTLAEDGRLIALEPYVSPFSFLIRTLFHHEEMDLMGQEGGKGGDKGAKDPFAASLMLPTRLFYWEVGQFQRRFPKLKIVHRELHSTIVYPFSGGFNYVSLLPCWSYRPLKMLEQLLTPFNGWFSFKMLVVVERHEGQ